MLEKKRYLEIYETGSDNLIEIEVIKGGRKDGLFARDCGH